MKKALIVLLVLFAAASAAMADGIVTVYMPSPAGLANKLAADFEAKTGIEVRTFQGTTGEILARLETEQANPVADVVILASWSDGLSMKESGQLESYVPANADKMVPGWIDDDSCLFGYSAGKILDAGVCNTTVRNNYCTTDFEQLSSPGLTLVSLDMTDEALFLDAAAGDFTLIDGSSVVYQQEYGDPRWIPVDADVK